jgi:AraC-like DNA-binding protein
VVAVPRQGSSKVWSHGYPYRKVRWHFHREHEIHLITSTTGKYFVGDCIGKLAELAGQSVSAFSRYFRPHTGAPFVQYVNRQRIDLAWQLLMSGQLNVTAICHRVGFNNPSKFNRQFLSLKGCRRCSQCN